MFVLTFVRYVKLYIDEVESNDGRILRQNIFRKVLQFFRFHQLSY